MRAENCVHIWIPFEKSFEVGLFSFDVVRFLACNSSLWYEFYCDAFCVKYFVVWFLFIILIVILNELFIFGLFLKMSYFFVFHCNYSEIDLV